MSSGTNVSSWEINIVNLLSSYDSRSAEVINGFVTELFGILDSEWIDQPNYLDASDLIRKKLEWKTAWIRRKLSTILSDYRTERSFHQELSKRFPLHNEWEEKIDEHTNTINPDSNIWSNADNSKLSSRDNKNSNEWQKKLDSSCLV